MPQIVTPSHHFTLDNYELLNSRFALEHRYNINRRHSLNQIKADMLTVLRDMTAFRNVLMNEMGVTHEGIFFDVGGVAEDFKLYLIDRHFVQGKFEYVVFEREVR